MPPWSYESTPLWALYPATVAAGFLVIEAGYRLGRWRSPEPEKESSITGMEAATLGLLAFMLAFTFGLASGRFDARRQLIPEEANAIRTSLLRSAFLPEPQRSAVRRLLAEYLDARLEASQPGKSEQALAASRRLQNQLWAEAVAAAEKDSRLTALFVQSLNNVIDIHEKRIHEGLNASVPGVIWTTLYFVAGLAMAGIGYHEGLTNSRRSPVAIALVLTFSTVLALIADLDRPQEGLLRLSYETLHEVRSSFP